MFWNKAVNIDSHSKLMQQMKNVKTLLSHLVGNQNTLSTNVLFIDFTGSHEKAQLLSQMFYWSSRTKRKDGFFAKSYADWWKEIRVREQSIRRYARDFEEKGFLEIKTIRFNKRPTLHYRVNQDRLIEVLLAFVDTLETDPYHSDTPITVSDEPLSPSKGTPITVSDLLTETTQRLQQREDAHDQEKEKQPKAKKLTSPKQPKIETDWKPAANAIVLDKDAVKQIKQDADLKPSQKVGPFAKDYFLNLKAKGEFYRLKIPQSESARWSWRAKHIAGITQWIIREHKFYPKRKEKQAEPVPPCYTNTFDYSILENRS